MIKIGIVGGTGYTGAELLRILVAHPMASIQIITSRGDEGKDVADLFPNLRGFCDLKFTPPDLTKLVECDLVFFATPHGVAQAMVPSLIKSGVRVIDLSADFRIRNIPLWEKWYHQVHQCPELVPLAIYGLPEVNRHQIRSAQLIACPGCYPTSVQLGFLPLLRAGVVDPLDLVANSASGVSGAGRQAKMDYLFTEISDSYKAYGVSGHRHLPEIEQGLQDIQSGRGQPAQLTFIPHLLPIGRGILSTLYATLIDQQVDLQALFEEAYQHEPFVDVLPAGGSPETRSVRGTNICRIAVHRPQNRNKVVILVAEDNLTKGASGQAIQNMNIMFDLPETMGLDRPSFL